MLDREVRPWRAHFVGSTPFKPSRDCGCFRVQSIHPRQRVGSCDHCHSVACAASRTSTGRSALVGNFIRRTMMSGAIGSAASAVALVLVALEERRGPAQPLNVTSHWLNGDRGSRQHDIDLRHTGVGLATHVAATVFWAASFEAWLALRPPKDRGELAAQASTVAALAAAVDYTITPKRFTPGWELVLTKTSMAAVYAAMAAGFFASGILRPIS